jgi:hypothetical protein
MSVVFKPVGILSGAMAGLVGRKLYERMWRLVDSQNPPAPSHDQVSLPRLTASLALEGAISQVARGLADHGARRGFAALTGEWPG